MPKQLTLAIIHKDGKVLLGMKKRGFGAGRWNGFGGKVEAGETVEEAARREMREEAGIETADLKELGVVEFDFKENPGPLEVHIFKATDFSGAPEEGEEMRPQWFETDKIPFADMWPDDIHWMPLFLEGKKFAGRFLYGPGDAILEKELGEA